MVDTPCCCCGSRFSADCCAPLVDGSRPALTAESLMRSRYTANVLKNTAYLLATWHASSRPQFIDPDGIPAWCGLTIVSVEQGCREDRSGVVEFRALYRETGGMGVLHERSSFVFEDGQWFYLGGELLQRGGLRSGKTGRNEPCPCGSGKKYKKCCLQ